VLDGQPLVVRAAATCLATATGPVAVVLGAHGDEVADAVGELRVAHVGNPDWRDGIASSIRAAVRWAETTGAGALLIALADQPLVPPDHLVALRAAWLAGAPIAASRFGGVVGAPALFDRSRWHQLAELVGDQGAGRLVRGSDVAVVDCEAAGHDVDTDDDLAAVRAATSS
jgi:xanthine dehydrogenase accessory factor